MPSAISDTHNLYQIDHELPPFIAKQHWNALGGMVTQAEDPHPVVAGEHWMSVRLDGNGFSKLLKKLRSVGIFPPGVPPPS